MVYRVRTELNARRTTGITHLRRPRMAGPPSPPRPRPPQSPPAPPPPTMSSTMAISKGAAHRKIQNGITSSNLGSSAR